MNRPAVVRTSFPISPVRLAAVTWAAQPIETNSKRSSGRAAKPRLRSGWLMMGTKPLLMSWASMLAAPTGTPSEANSRKT